MDDTGLTLTDLYAAIGETLVRWGFLESVMNSEGIDWRRSVPIGEDLEAAFLRDLAHPKSVRNALAHGIVSASGNPWSDVEPFVVCVDKEGEKRILTLSEIKRAQTEIEQLMTRLRRGLRPAS